MHLFHNIRKTKLIQDSGAGFYYANDLYIYLNNKDFPNQQYIIKSEFDTLDILALLMYYCAPSELSAFMQSYNQESRGYIVYHTGHPEYKAASALKLNYKTQIYRVYEKLLNSLNINDIITVIRNNKDLEISEILKFYCQEIGVKSIYSLPNIWKRKIEKFLKDAQAVHIHNCDTYPV